MNKIRIKSRPAPQLELFSNDTLPCPPSTRYQGSKLKLLDWIWESLRDLEFESVLDAFGGTGCVAYRMKAQQKQVTYNDSLRFNQIIGRALIENSSNRLPTGEAESLFVRTPSMRYSDFIETTFSDIYFTKDENCWLDTVCQNILAMKNVYKQSLAFYALFQACIIKRPYNLFHRKNLYMRMSDVKRSFGNKATWDTPFEVHFKAFLNEANEAVFDSGIPCRSLCCDALEVPGDYDLVYIDTPYLNGNGVGVDYLQFYHFLEGIADYSNWPFRINRERKHIPLVGERSPWSDPKRTNAAFDQLFDRYSKAILVVSYRSDGVPTEDCITSLLRRHKRSVRALHYGEYKYVLSKNGNSKEILLIGY